ncbi:MAG: hypothetical protein M3044_09980 [Thermoproteota archaeon]|nr:hypothetical protein [Thermoproteota archaeon]
MEIALVEADAAIEPRASNANVDPKPNANHQSILIFPSTHCIGVVT